MINMTVDEYREMVLGGGAAKPSKYRNKKARRVTASGKMITFDSQKEAARFMRLELMNTFNEISEFKLQPQFTLQEAYKKPDGEQVRAIRYQADFSYRDSGGELVVEDVKGVKTQEYILKKKLMHERYGITIKET